jgi:CheY-like chemotaxis protein
MTTTPLLRLLVVDDEPEILAEVSGYLRRRGEDVVTGSSYGQAMRVLDDNTQIDILISDARMPDGNGVDLVRSAIQRPNGPRACILITGHLEESDLEADLQRAGVKIIFKPFSLSVLYREVRAASEAKGLGRPAPAEDVASATDK